MPHPEISIERIEPMWVASAHVVGERPEREAWARLRAWAEPLGLLDSPDIHPVFGFNNPNPAPDTPRYGYEFWIRVDPGAEPGIEPAPGVEVKEVPGGLYAVTPCKLIDDPRGTVAQVWMALWEWVQESDYSWRKTHELEKHLDPDAPLEEMVLSLYLPIQE